MFVSLSSSWYTKKLCLSTCFPYRFLALFHDISSFSSKPSQYLWSNMLYVILWTWHWRLELSSLVNFLLFPGCYIQEQWTPFVKLSKSIQILPACATHSSNSKLGKKLQTLFCGLYPPCLGLPPACQCHIHGQGNGCETQPVGAQTAVSGLILMCKLPRFRAIRRAWRCYIFPGRGISPTRTAALSLISEAGESVF